MPHLLKAWFICLLKLITVNICPLVVLIKPFTFELETRGSGLRSCNVRRVATHKGDLPSSGFVLCLLSCPAAWQVCVLELCCSETLFHVHHIDLLCLVTNSQFFTAMLLRHGLGARMVSVQAPAAAWLSNQTAFHGGLSGLLKYLQKRTCHEGPASKPRLNETGLQAISSPAAPAPRTESWRGSPKVRALG